MSDRPAHYTRSKLSNLPIDQERKIPALWEEFRDVRLIAQKIGVSKSAMYRILDRMGLRNTRPRE